MPVIVGYGRAGRDLHHRSLRSLAAKRAVPTGEALVVDPACRDGLPADARWCASPAAAAAVLGDPGRGVFHVTTPASQHLKAVRELLSAGARRFIVEKPLAPTAAQARALLALIEEAGGHLVPVGVWPSSAVTREAIGLLDDGRIGRLKALQMEQHKPRFRRSLSNDAHGSALQIEMPHQVLLALHLCGTAHLTGCATWPMVLPGATLPHLGGARVGLEHTGPMGERVTSTLVSDLTSPVRVRRLTLTGTAGEITAHYPISGDDPFGQIWITGQERPRIVPDAPLTALIEDAYQFYLGNRPRPPGTEPALHLAAMEVLDAAAAASTAPHGEMEAPALSGPRKAASC
ncbi:Gfo/Idh/MocA family oxidoreductase [Streptomyces monashensis]|uniref:Gfo/Idh/MocA-like oxidoreductase N-terminal domain-containing protein n=1 Tax=Streptomyces monashensis TaxID=1678012 RepID=A0A1S2QNQ5_9ACTN|nr:Gfo/Idh/MocA family oxidoreductase [Streptomyces monashensis]OIK07779.1 hypothetical protein BIV23_02030 [Streptomyces monashensis]